jgi:hypothetical protein
MCGRLLRLRSDFRAPGLGRDAALPCGARSTFLSWDSLLGSPSPTCPRPSTPRRCCQRPSGKAAKPLLPVPPSWVCTTSTVFSGSRVPGLLHPGAGHGVRSVSPWHRVFHPRVASVDGTVPRNVFVPFEDFPSPIAVPHRCGRCLPAVRRPPPEGGALHSARHRCRGLAVTVLVCTPRGRFDLARCLAFAAVAPSTGVSPDGAAGPPHERRSEPWTPLLQASAPGCPDHTCRRESGTRSGRRRIDDQPARPLPPPLGCGGPPRAPPSVAGAEAPVLRREVAVTPESEDSSASNHAERKRSAHARWCLYPDHLLSQR